MVRAIGIAAGLMLWSAGTSLTLAQPITNPDSIPKNTFVWDQAERELGFRFFDEVFEARQVPRGDRVAQIPAGKPISVFANGGEKEAEFEAFLSEQKVAGLLIMQDGKIRTEHYGLGLSREGRWTSQSCAKSVTSTLLGIAIKDGYINSVDDYLFNYIPELEGSAYEQVTIHQLLCMNTGVRWKESYTEPDSDLFGLFTTPIDSGMDHIVSYMRTLPAEAEPGKKWNYSTGETHLLGTLVSKATGQRLSDYLSKKIWIPYGMEQNASWVLGLTDQEMAGCCLQLSLRDFARFGQFVLDGGVINGRSIVPDQWFETATKTQIPLGIGWGYGYQWWTMANGSFRAIGIHGQMLHIDAKRRLVVAVFSAWPEPESNKRRFARNQFLNTISSELDQEYTEIKATSRLP